MATEKTLNREKERERKRAGMGERDGGRSPDLDELLLKFWKS